MTFICPNLWNFPLLLVYRDWNLLQSLLELYSSFEFLSLFFYFGLVSINKRTKFYLRSTIDRRSSHLIELFISLFYLTHVFLLMCFEGIVVYFCWNFMIFLVDIIFELGLLLKLLEFLLYFLKFRMQFAIL